MKDFTLKTYERLIANLERRGYRFYTFEQFILERPLKAVVLRHDVDRRPESALEMAELENSRSVAASYHFRVFPGRRGLKESTIIRKIIGLDHEIAYHYEDYSREMSGKWRVRLLRNRRRDLSVKFASAWSNFNSNLEYLRQFYPVRIISMHGNPISAFDNRKLWEHYNYRDSGVLCEPYLDLDYSEILYLTDTGRCWNAGSANRRDRITRTSDNCINLPNVRTTFDLLKGIDSGKLPERLIINTHPQRWTDHFLPWLSEYLGQNIRNFIKSKFFY